MTREEILETVALLIEDGDMVAVMEYIDGAIGELVDEAYKQGAHDATPYGPNGERV